ALLTLTLTLPVVVPTAAPPAPRGARIEAAPPPRDLPVAPAALGARTAALTDLHMHGCHDKALAAAAQLLRCLCTAAPLRRTRFCAVQFVTQLRTAAAAHACPRAVGFDAAVAAQASGVMDGLADLLHAFPAETATMGTAWRELYGWLGPLEARISTRSPGV